MSILTKEERDRIRAASLTCDESGRSEPSQLYYTIQMLRDALDTIDELEAQIDAIEAIARSNQDTRIIGGAHAALREILAVIEGDES